MSARTGFCEAITGRGKPCCNSPRDGRFCHHHGHQAQCLAWTPDGPCEERASGSGGYCPKHENTP